MSLPDFELPAWRREAIIAEFGDGARTWLVDFPKMLARCVERWNLELEVMVPGGLPINVIFHGTSEGKAVTLKTGYPHPELFTEMKTLALYDGCHAVRLIDVSEDAPAILMERIMPGTKLRDVANDITRSQMRIDIMDQLPVAVDDNPGLPTFAGWVDKAFRAFREDGGRDREFSGFIEQAEACFEEIIGRGEPSYLLHGDLHHENILLDESRGWLAIDPKGVTGPKILESGRFLHNFIADEIPDVSSTVEATTASIREILEIRVATFADTLDVDAGDLLRVAWVDLILGSCWVLNSGGDADESIAIARALAPMLPRYS